MTISSPLWDLTCKDAKWQWGLRENKAFRDIKTRLTDAPVMAYHRQRALTCLTTDGLLVGIRAILEQEQEDGSYKPIYYAANSVRLKNTTTDLKEKLWPSDGHAKPSTCVAIEAMPSVLVPKQVEIASAEDPTLQLVHQVIVTLVVKGNLLMIG